MENIRQKDHTTLPEGAAPLVSVIVPVYNVRPYIEEALDSLVSQTYGRLEIILVDDGSTDGSGEVCDRYASRDARFRVIHQENRGLSAARNAGLDCMTGEIVAFLDPDDAFHPDMIHKLLNAMLQGKADMAACKICTVQGLGSISRVHRHRQATQAACRILSRKEALCKLANRNLGTAVWNKLYLRRLWNGLRFPVGRVFEDLDTTYRIIDRISTCCVVDDALVFYRVRPDSITQRLTANKLEDWLLASDHYMAYLQAHSPALISPAQLTHIEQHWFKSLLSRYGSLQRLNVDADVQARWKQRILETGRAVEVRNCNLRTRMGFALACRWPRLYGLAYLGYIAVRMAIYRVLHI